MGVFQDFVGRFSQTMGAYLGDRALMEAAVSASANVILADYEIDEEEIEVALAGMRANPILERGYDTLKLEAELFEGIARARTRAGRAENLRFVAAIAEREIAQRTSVFLIAADVADQAGISEPEHAALAEIAAALGVDKDALLGTIQKA
ncbi:Tellurite resistance protein TerB [Methylobacterium sp. V23]|jgi:tellurite resistance protein|uniref:Tellurite resistance protein TerB n=1 Tax=Methylobacterium sp. V23 TaxID=2044878 RepID=UPI000CDA5B62|nr:Tellurite resistance protein TerB [Methylobacterium sp. V23]POR43421.1 Tellurite resistance protein TerB [Methylobacterium sp. V23]